MLKINRAHSSVIRAASSVAVAGVAVKAISILKEIAVASTYGRSAELDAYLIAILLPGLLVNLISESMNQALIPTFIKVKESDGRQEAQKLFSSAMFYACIMLLVVSVVSALTAHCFLIYIRLNFSVSQTHLCAKIFYATLPIVILAGVASNCAAVMNACGQFLLPTFAPMIIPTVIAAFLWTSGSKYGIWGMVVANVVGSLLHAGVMLWMIYQHGYSLRLYRYSMSDSMRDVAYQYGPVLLSSVVASGGLLVDQMMAAYLPTGSVSALAYANRYISVIFAILATAISTVIGPHFARLIAHNDWRACAETIRVLGIAAAIVTIPVAITLICMASCIVKISLQHGAFRSEDTHVVAHVLMLYGVQIPFIVVSRVFYRFLIAMRRADLILYCGILNLVLDIVLNIICMHWLGVAGIALATSLWSISTFLFLGYWTYKLLYKGKLQSQYVVAV